MLLQITSFPSFLWLISIPFCIYHVFFTHSSGHLSCFHFLAVVSCAVTNIEVHVYFKIMVFSRYMPRSGIAGSDGAFMFSVLRTLQTVLHSGHTSLYTHYKSRRVPFSPHLLERLLFVDFLMVVILTSLR